MKISVSEAKAQLTDLVRRAEAGEEMVLTRHSQPIARIAPLQVPVGAAERRRPRRGRHGQRRSGCRPQPGFPLRR